MHTAYLIDEAQGVSNGWSHRNRCDADRTREIITQYVECTWVLGYEDIEAYVSARRKGYGHVTNPVEGHSKTKEVIDLEDLMAGLRLRHRPPHRMLTYFHARKDSYPSRHTVRVFKIPALVTEKVAGLDQLMHIVRQYGPILIPESWCEDELGTEGDDKEAIDRSIALDFKMVPSHFVLATYDPPRVVRRIRARKAAAKRKMSTKYLLPDDWTMGKQATAMVGEVTDVFPDLSVFCSLQVCSASKPSAFESFEKLCRLHEKLSKKRYSYRKTVTWRAMMRILDKYEEGFEHKAVLLSRKSDKTWDAQQYFAMVEFFRKEKRAWQLALRRIARRNAEKVAEGIAKAKAEKAKAVRKARREAQKKVA